jgi:hypothetical protein
MTPAAPHTYVVSKEPSASEGFTKEPVIGFVYEHGKDKPPVVVTLQGERRLLGESGVMFPCGMVSDPMHGLDFESVEAWLESNVTSTRDQHAAPAPKKTPARERDEEAVGDEDSPYDVEWLAPEKAFKNNSFWHYDDGTYEFVMQLPGGEAPPKASEKMSKIKRDDFMRLKKDLDALDPEDVKNPSVLPDQDPEDEDDDEDDGGLI